MPGSPAARQLSRIKLELISPPTAAYITGKNLQLIKNRLIVQSWHGSDWAAGEPDSVFMLFFEQKKKDVVLYVTHANLPDAQAQSIDEGWHTYYWQPWKK